MSIDTDESVADAPARALSGYVARMRRQQRIYVIVLVVLALLVFALVQIVLRTGEIAHASLHQAKTAVPAPAVSDAAATQTQAWHSADTAAVGNPTFHGTVVTYDAHTVTGRNYATGAAAWTYTRTDVRTCTVIQENGTTVAIYTDPDGYCDEASAFVTGTGARLWYRTLDSNGNTLNGRAVFAASQMTILVIAPAYVQAVDPVQGIDRWTFIQPSGCTTTSAVLGTSGMLMAQHCADGDHVLLRDGLTGDDDKDKAKSKWRVKSSSVVAVSADDLISAIDPKTGLLVHYSTTEGKVIGSQALQPAPDPQAAITQMLVASNEVVTVGATTYGIDSTTAKQVWSAQLLGQPILANGSLLAITAQGISKLDPDTGKATVSYQIGPAPAGAPVYSVATGFVVGGTPTTVYR